MILLPCPDALLVPLCSWPGNLTPGWSAEGAAQGVWWLSSSETLVWAQGQAKSLVLVSSSLSTTLTGLQVPSLINKVDDRIPAIFELLYVCTRHGSSVYIQPYLNNKIIKNKYIYCTFGSCNNPMSRYHYYLHFMVKRKTKSRSTEGK